MTRAQENRYKRVLLAKRDEVVREIGARRENLATARHSDPMDQVRSIADRDLDANQVDRLHRTLRMVEGALRELREGTFGVCARCGEDIPPRRLEAVPWSPFCVSCQEYAERARESGEGEAEYALAS